MSRPNLEPGDCVSIFETSVYSQVASSSAGVKDAKFRSWYPTGQLLGEASDFGIVISVERSPTWMTGLVIDDEGHVGWVTLVMKMKYEKNVRKSR